MSRSEPRIFDEYLVASAKAGDRAAFALLAKRWNGKLTAHAWRLLGNAEEAREAVQEGWVEIVRGLGRLADERAFPAWAYRIVSRRCAKIIDGSVRRRKIAEMLLADPPETEQPGADIPAVDLERMRAAIRTLPQEQRAAIALFHLEEMSVAEVAVALDVPAGTVKTRLMHARRKLLLALEGEEGCVTSTG
jgi:RNA polymerase sigma factor (sigma-70 family)